MKEKIQNMLDIIICILLVIVGVSKGGFYKEDVVFPVTAIIVLGFVYCVVKIILNIKENGVVRKNKLVTVLDIAMILMPISYFLPILFRKYVSLENSIFEFMRFTSTSIVYFISRTSKNKDTYLTLILVISCITAVFGIDEITYRIMDKVSLPINYLQKNASVVSSMVQYANVAAILMVIGIIIATNKLEKSKNYLYIFLIVLLQSVVFLTTSRMAFAVTLGVLICICVVCIKNKKLGLAFFSIMLYTLSLMVSGIVSSAVENNAVHIVYIVYALVLTLACLLNIKKESVRNIALKVQNAIYKNKRIAVYITLAIVAGILLVVSIPENVHVSNASKVVKVSNLNVGENAVYFEVEKESSDAEYSIVVTKIYDTYKPEKILEFKESDLENGVFNKSIGVDDDTKYLEFEFVATSGSIVIKNAKINGKSTAFGYIFMPDRLASRFKADGVLDLNNSLRAMYYLDGIKLWLNSPVVGLGGEGFKLCYQNVQEVSYVSSEAHSGFIQTLVETGVVGAVTYILIAVVAIWICIVLYKTDKKRGIYLLGVLAIYVMTTFDLMFSFAIVTYIFAVILGCASNEMLATKLNNVQMKKYEFDSDNKSMISMLKLGGFCIVAIVLAVSSKYMIDVYMASMIQLPELVEDAEDYEDKLYERLTLLENKLKKDKYNINYMIELDSLYYKYIDVLKQVSLNALSETEKSESNTLLAVYLLRQKANADNMVECEYFSKYAMEKVAICYFENYIRYAEVLSGNFENDEVAYAFYLNYALKLTNRLQELGPKNNVANNMYKGILETYIEALRNQNKYIKSPTIESVVQDMQKALDVI